MILGVTGHRPDRLGGYGDQAQQRLVSFAVDTLAMLGPDRAITGMALGWDMAVAEACVMLGIPFEAAVPFQEQAASWRHEQRDRYEWLLSEAATVTIISVQALAGLAYRVRNEYIVRNCEMLLALHDGGPGGTDHAIREAAKYGARRPVWNVWPQWLERL